MNEKYDDVTVGTVESCQGREKRVIIVSTVRANCRLLDYDAKYGLGFLVDDKVTIFFYIPDMLFFPSTSISNILLSYAFLILKE